MDIEERLLDDAEEPPTGQPAAVPTARRARVRSHPVKAVQDQIDKMDGEHAWLRSACTALVRGESMADLFRKADKAARVSQSCFVRGVCMGSSATKLAIRDAGAVPLLVDMLSGGARERQMALAALKTCAYGCDEVKDAIRAADGIPALVRLLTARGGPPRSDEDPPDEVRSHSDDYPEPGRGHPHTGRAADPEADRAQHLPFAQQYVASLGLTGQPRGSGAAAAVTEGVVQIRSRAPPPGSTLRNAAALLSNLGFRFENQVALHAAGGVVALAQLLVNGTTELTVREAAVDALWRNAQAPANKLAIAQQSGVIAALVSIVEGEDAPPPRMKESAAGLLQQLVLPKHPENDEAARMIVKAQAIPALVTQAQAGTHAQKVKAGDALRALSHYRDEKGTSYQSYVFDCGFYGV